MASAIRAYIILESEKTHVLALFEDLQNVQTNAMFYVHLLHYVVDNFRERDIVKSLL